MVVVVELSWPWKSLSPMSETGVTPPVPLTHREAMDLPWLYCGSGMPSM
jgi:hypothetical protein